MIVFEKGANNVYDNFEPKTGAPGVRIQVINFPNIPSKKIRTTQDFLKTRIPRLIVAPGRPSHWADLKPKDLSIWNISKAKFNDTSDTPDRGLYPNKECVLSP